MADLARKTASVYINHASASEALESLQKQADRLTEKIKKGEAAGKSMVKEISQLSKVKGNLADVQKQIDTGMRPSFNQLEAAVKRLRAELKKMSEDAPGYAEKFKAFNAASTELDRLGRSIRGVQKDGGGLKDEFKDLLPVAAAALAIKSFFGDAISEARDAERTTARFRATMDNLGNTEAFDRLIAKAQQMADKFKFINNDDVVGVFEKLIDYGRLTETQINNLIPVIIDFAAKQRISLVESSDAIVKALEGNGLKEFGIHIKDAGTETDRLNIIMTTLKDKVDGAADAFNDVTDGRVATAEQQFAKLKEELGTGLLPVLNSLLSKLVNVGTALKTSFSSLKQFLSGESGLRAFAEQQVTTPERVQAIQDQAEQIVSSYNNIGIEIEKTSGKAAATEKVIAEAQAKILENRKTNLAQDKLRFEAISKNASGGIFKNKYAQELRDVLISIKATEQAINTIEAGKNTKVLGNSGGLSNVDDKAAGEAQRKREAEAKRLADEARRKLEQLQKDIRAFATKNADELQKLSNTTYIYTLNKLEQQQADELQLLDDGLKAGAIQQQEYDATRLQSQQVYAGKVKELQDKMVADYLQQLAKETAADEERAKQREAALKEFNTLEANGTNQRFNAARRGQAGKDVADAQAGVELSAPGRERLQASLKLLDAQREQELLNTELTEQQKAAIRQKYNDAAISLSLDSFKQQADLIAQIAGGALQIFSSIGQIQGQKDQAKISEKNKQAEEERNNAKKLLDKKAIDQEAYDAKIKKINDRNQREVAAIQKKQFEREKRLQIIQTIMNGAQAVVSTLAAKPGVTDIISLSAFRAINIGLVAATTAAQIAVIASQKAPQYARGGMLNGPLHSQGGMPVINPATGRKVAEVEGGEPILSRRTYANNRPLVDALLYSSMHRSGATIQPQWMSRAYRGINYSAISQAQHSIKRYERGGVFTTSDGTAGINAEVLNLLASLSTQLSQPIKTYVVYQDVKQNQQIDEMITAETSFRRSA